MIKTTMPLLVCSYAGEESSLFGFWTALAKDSKERVYIIDDNKVLRYSPDLLTKEEFAIKDANTNHQFAIAEESNFVRIYQNLSGEIRTARVPM
jgi:hypothetical protein